MADSRRHQPVSRQEFDELREVVEGLLAAAPAHPTELDGEKAAEQPTLWALRGLEDRIDDPAGAVLLTGSVEPQPGARYEWQETVSTVSLLESDWTRIAATLDALAHPVRLQLLQLVLTGTDRTAALGAAEGLGTSGQLHHHLRQLVAAGWLRSAGRGRYEIPAPRVVPLLVVLAAAER